jgi:hypothetical protein
MVGLDLRNRDRKFKDGRHVGLDFYDLLIEVGLPETTWASPPGFEDTALVPHRGDPAPDLPAVAA